jgi:hypothetical protein
MELNKGIKKLKALSSLCLNFGWDHNFRHIKKNLNLDVRWNPDLTDVSVIELAKNLKELKQLNQLSINFDGCINLTS